MTERPSSSRITRVSLTEPPDEHRGRPCGAQSTVVPVLPHHEPAAGRTAREGVARRHCSQIEARVTAVAADNHSTCYFARHLLTLRVRSGNGLWAIRLRPGPQSLRPTACAYL